MTPVLKNIMTKTDSYMYWLSSNNLTPSCSNNLTPSCVKIWDIALTRSVSFWS